MAFSARRSLATSLSHHFNRRLHPSLSHLVPPHHDRREDPSSSSAPPPPTQQTPPFPSGDFRRRSRSQTLPLSLPFGAHLGAHRNFSSSSSGAEIDAAAGVLSDPAAGQMDVAAGLLSDAATSAVHAFPAPFPGEVAAAAADSFPPVAALQYVIDAVHSFTGLNWWASIAVTTILIRTATIPLLVNQMKSTMKLNAMRPEIERINMEMRNSSMDPQAMMEGKRKLGELFTKGGVNPLTPLKGLFIQGPIFMSFFFAIQNMVEKVPSLKGGGAYWFTDLTTPDELYILPVLTSATFLATVELNMQEGMEGNPMLQTMKKFSRVLAVMTIPFTMHFPKAIFCYWVTANLFSLGYGFALRKTAVRYFLNLPAVVPHTEHAPVSTFKLFEGPKLLPAVEVSPSAAEGSPEGSEQSKAELKERVVDLEKKIAELERRAKARGESEE